MNKIVKKNPLFGGLIFICSLKLLVDEKVHLVEARSVLNFLYVKYFPAPL